jgi:chemotaxis protein CheC
VVRNEGRSLFDGASTPQDDGVVLFLYINFAISQADIRGYIAILMDMPSLDALKMLIGEFIERVAGPHPVG